MPRPAATVILLRDGHGAPELLLVRRTPKASFMGGVWVFPGGAVEAADARGVSRKASSDEDADTNANDGAGADSEDDTDAHALRNAARRELREEAGIELAESDELMAFSRWITPSFVSTRFDTHFFLARMPAGQTAHVDGEECVEHRWFTSREALGAHERGEIALVFPTIKHLEQLNRFDSVEALLSHARGRPVVAVEPKRVGEGEVARMLLPGDAGY